MAKENTVANQRLAYSRLQSKEAVAKLLMSWDQDTKIGLEDILRVIKRGYRPGDKAPAAQVEFVKEEASDTEVTDEITEETA